MTKTMQTGGRFISWIDSLPLWALILVIFIVALAITAIIVGAGMSGAERNRNAPCSEFSAHKLADVPARCVRELIE